MPGTGYNTCIFPHIDDFANNDTQLRLGLGCSLAFGILPMITSKHVLGLFVPKFWVHSHHCRPYWRPLSTLGGNRRCAVWVLQALDACLLVACYTMITLTQLFGFFVLFWAYSSIQGVLQAPGGPWCTLGSTESSARAPIHHRNKQMMFNDVITTKNT